jgi:hypothetical protein
MTPRGQFNRTFVVGLAGATFASLGLFALSLAGGEIRDEGAGNSSRHPTASLVDRRSRGHSVRTLR